MTAAALVVKAAPGRCMLVWGTVSFLERQRWAWARKRLLAEGGQALPARAGKVWAPPRRSESAAWPGQGRYWAPGPESQFRHCLLIRASLWPKAEAQRGCCAQGRPVEGRSSADSREHIFQRSRMKLIDVGEHTVQYADNVLYIIVHLKCLQCL